MDGNLRRAYADYISRRDTRARGCHAARSLPSATRPCRASLEDYFDTLRPVCFLHDLTIKNVLVDDNELSGLIDFDSVCYGDPLLVLGTTLAHIDTLVGERGRRYAEALLRCWAPQGERRRATGFYASLWVIGFLAAAIEQGNAASVHFLTPVVDQLLRVAERA
nr:aminoglycoside phosphotransferase family protein [Paraburkholderia bryophila]